MTEHPEHSSLSRFHLIELFSSDPQCTVDETARIPSLVARVLVLLAGRHECKQLYYMQVTTTSDQWITNECELLPFDLSIEMREAPVVLG